jgi:threonine synthase
MSTLKEPYRIEGKKIMGYELVEQFRWKAPDVIIYPTGGGTGLIGMWKAFDELEQLGWIDSKRPKMVVVQSSGCAPIVKAFEEGKTKAEEWKNPSTIASGLKVPLTIGDFLILDIIKKSRGTAISVSDKEILESMKEFTASEGIFVSPEGAATLAGLKKLKEQKFVSVSERILLFNTASGLKYIDVFKI